MVTTRAAQDTTGGADESLLDTRLLTRLRQLVTDEGRGRAAEQLGVDRKTVWRVLNSEQLSPVVREALVNLDTRVSDSDEGGRDDAGVRELRHRIAILEDRLPDVERQLAQVGDALAERHESQPAAVAPTPVPAAARPQAIPTAYVPRRIYPERVVLEPRPDDEQVHGTEVFALVTEWRERHAEFKAHWPTIPGYEAEIRMVELEVQLIGEHELTFSTDEPPWPNWRRRQELQDRAERLEVARHKLRKKRIRRAPADAGSLGSLTCLANRAIAVPRSAFIQNLAAVPWPLATRSRPTCVCMTTHHVRASRLHSWAAEEVWGMYMNLRSIALCNRAAIPRKTLGLRPLVGESVNSARGIAGSTPIAL